jgi:arsenite transporter
MIVAFAPIVGLLLGLSAITVPWDTLLLSVALYIVVPVIVAQVARNGCSRAAANRAWLNCCSRLQPALASLRSWRRSCSCSVPGRADHRAAAGHPLLAVPILIQVYFNSGLAYLLNRARASSTAWPRRPR